MRAANAALVAGIAIVIAGLSGASLAAEESGRTTPQDVVATEEVGGADTAPGEETDPAEPGSGEPGRAPEELETEPVEPTDDGGRGGERGASGGRGEDDPGKRDKRDEKKPLADVGVDMVNITFKPKSVTVKPGDEVTWKNKDTAQHNAVGQGAADFDTGLLEKGETGTVPFNDTGTFRYICTVHPTMKGEVVVGSGGSGGGGKGGTSSGTGDTSSGTGGGSVFPSGSGGSGGFSGGGGSSSGGGSLPNTGQAEIPLLLLGSALIVFGLLARAFREYWIWR